MFNRNLIDLRYMFDRFSMIGAGLENIGGGSDEGWRRIGEGLEENVSIDFR